MTFLANLLLAACCTAGHAALMVAVMNRVDALRISRFLQKTCSRLHELLLVAFPAALVWVFVWPPGSDATLFWDRLPSAAAAYCYACLAISAFLPVRLIQYVFRRPPAVLIGQRLRRVDVPAELGFRPVGREGLHFLTWLPGNESLIFEVAEKEIRVPRLPPAWDGLRVLHLSDLHFTGTIERAWFEQVFDAGAKLQPDLVAFTGDLLDRPELLEWLPETFGRLQAPLGCWFVLGNHDWYAGDPPTTRRQLQKLGWRDASAGLATLEHRDHTLVLGGTERPWMGDHADFGQAPPEAFRLLLSHSPDQISLAKSERVDLMLAGHTHGGQVKFPVIGPIYSPSLYGTLFSDGLFWEQPTVMHVSRGLSGEAPLRFGCAPELAILVLRS